MRVLLFTYLALISTVTASGPNIVLIISDDQAWTAYGFMGHPDIKTPHIDELAKEGMKFTHTILDRQSVLLAVAC